MEQRTAMRSRFARTRLFLVKKMLSCRRVPAPILLILLALLFFLPLVRHPARVLYADYSDALAQHLPYKRFLARSWRETGEIPLWCPHSFGGTPFVHDPQVGIFYPPNFVLLVAPDRLIGAAFSWLIVLQIIAGGLFAYAYALEEGLERTGAFVTGAGFMLSGKWLLHLLPAGHTIVVGLAWLPLIVLCFERSLRRRSPGWAVSAGGCLALLVLGTHPQWTLYAGLFVAVWTLGTALEEARNWGAAAAGLVRWVGLGALVVGIAVVLSAIQLLPSWEAVGYASRHCMAVAHANGDGTGLTAALPAWLGLVGPSLVRHPDWECGSGIGLLWAMAAIAGACLGGRKVWWRATACFALFAFALTGGLGLHHLPPMNLFRGPYRMLLLTSLPIALLAGRATSILPRVVASLGKRRVLLVILAAVAAGGMFYTAFRVWRLPTDQRYFRVYWMTLALTAPALLVLAVSPARWLGQIRAPLWCLLLVADLLALSWPFVRVERQEHIFRESRTLAFLAERREDRGRVLDAFAAPFLSPLGSGAPMAVNEGLYAVRGYNPLDYFRYKNYLRILSGTSLPTAPSEDVDGFPLTNRRLFDLLGVRYLLQPAACPPGGPAWRLAFRGCEHLLSFNYTVFLGGMQRTPPYSVYENEQVMPRAFVAPQALTMPKGREREALLATDFRQTVLVEGCDPADFAAGPADGFRKGRITEYQPNRVRIEVDGEHPGWLVLTDMWFPGWTCTVDGEAQPIYPGDYLFRTVPVPAGKHEVVMRFAPASYRLGRAISLGGLIGLALWGLASLTFRFGPAGLQQTSAVAANAVSSRIPSR
jgi:hypothetical protein